MRKEVEMQNFLIACLVASALLGAFCFVLAGVATKINPDLLPYLLYWAFSMVGIAIISCIILGISGRWLTGQKGGDHEEA